MTSLPTLRRRHRRPVRLREHAAEDLRFIRQTMERVAEPTAIPGWGQVGMGATALAAAAWASRAPNETAWLALWLIEAVLAMTLGSIAMALKSRTAGARSRTGSWRRFALAFSLPVIAGGVLTARLHGLGFDDVLPGTWMLLYGVGVAAGGTFSVAVVRTMGIAFMALGAAALFAPTAARDVWMAAGFGGLHIVFGLWIARRHGG